MDVTVLLFGSAREAAGVDRVTVRGLPANATTPQLLLEALKLAAGGSADGNALLNGVCVGQPDGTVLSVNTAAWCGLLTTTVLAVNEEYVDLDGTGLISSSDEVALIPPISGG
jgi:molybdopterin converting factor small subunit